MLSKIYGHAVEVDAAPVDAIASALTSFGIGQNFAGLMQEMYAGLTAGLVAFDGQGRRVRGTVDAEAALRGLGAGASS